MSKRRVVITGMGLVSPYGSNTEEVFEQILQGVSAVRELQIFPPERPYKRTIGAPPIEVAIEEYLPNIEKKEVRRLDPHMKYALIAAQIALENASMFPFEEGSIDRTRGGVLVGSGMGGLTTIETNMYLTLEGYNKISPFFIAHSIVNMGGARVAIEYGIQGPCYGISTACATSSNTLLAAKELIELGKADFMLAGGAEAAMTVPGFAGFFACRALSHWDKDPQEASRPFDKDRSGFVMSSGAAVLVLESYEHAMKRGAKILAEFAGGATTCDAFDIVLPDLKATGASRAMQLALDDAGLRPQDIGYINAHGTSTYQGDLSEMLAIAKVFAGCENSLNISSTKSMHGHSLGSSGAFESILAIMALRTGKIPPTINLNNPIDEVGNFDLTANIAAHKELNAVMKNAFGFGGHNVSLVFKKFEEG
ncbi:MAG: beta-ketoacyl-[acyl-carrier-protein] synthase family protein [Chlamydiia bacterium]